MMSNIKEEEEKVARGAVYEDTYKMRQIGGGISVSVPKKVVKRKARELDMDVEDFTEQYMVQAMYDDFKNIDLGLRFVKDPDYEEENGE